MLTFSAYSIIDNVWRKHSNKKDSSLKLKEIIVSNELKRVSISFYQLLKCSALLPSYVLLEKKLRKL